MSHSASAFTISSTMTANPSSSRASSSRMRAEGVPVSTGRRHRAFGKRLLHAGAAPGQGRAVERTFTPEERAAMGAAPAALGETAFHIQLNANARWGNVPAAVWNYRLGGYRILKKWLSYRECKVLCRPLRIEKVQHFAETTRRIGTLLAALRHESGRRS